MSVRPSRHLAPGWPSARASPRRFFARSSFCPGGGPGGGFGGLWDFFGFTGLPFARVGVGFGICEHFQGFSGSWLCSGSCIDLGWWEGNYRYCGVPAPVFGLGLQSPWLAGLRAAQLSRTIPAIPFPTQSLAAGCPICALPCFAPDSEDRYMLRVHRLGRSLDAFPFTYTHAQRDDVVCTLRVDDATSFSSGFNAEPGLRGRARLPGMRGRAAAASAWIFLKGLSGVARNGWSTGWHVWGWLELQLH